MKHKTPFAHHALQRACERYDIRLTQKQQQAFGRMLSNPKYTIPLTRNRLACYFEGRWYLLACNTVPTRQMPGYRVTVQTFLRLEDANDDDKRILRNDERYLKTNDDAFRVLSASRYNPTDPPLQEKLMIELPDLTEDELPQGEILSAEKVLNTYCDEKR